MERIVLSPSSFWCGYQASLSNKIKCFECHKTVWQISTTPSSTRSYSELPVNVGPGYRFTTKPTRSICVSTLLCRLSTFYDVSVSKLSPDLVWRCSRNKSKSLIIVKYNLNLEQEYISYLLSTEFDQDYNLSCTSTVWVEKWKYRELQLKTP